jgi:hypothetical protein
MIFYDFLNVDKFLIFAEFRAILKLSTQTICVKSI